MRNPIWLLAVAGAFALTGAAAAQTDAPDSGLAGFQSDPMMNLLTPRTLPTQRQQSPDAEKCADITGRVDDGKRAEACGKLIDSGQWKGAEIAWAYANRCVALMRLRQPDRAIADCDKAIELDAKNIVAWQARGMIKQGKSDSDGALADFDRAIENGAANAAIFSDRGNLLLAKGANDKALADYDKAIAAGGKNATLYLERGGAWLAEGKADEALGDYAKAIELSPDNAFAIYNRGVAFYMKGDKAKAVEDFKRALKLDPKNAYPGLWLFLTRTGSEGKADLQLYAAKFTQGAWPWPMVQYDLGAMDAAKALAEAKTPGDRCEAQFYIGAERLAKGAKDEGIAHLRNAVEICPKSFVEYIEAAARLNALGVQLPKAEAAPAPQPKAETAPLATQPDQGVKTPPKEEKAKTDEAPAAPAPAVNDELKK
jgi:lipoprotein NlpI